MKSILVIFIFLISSVSFATGLSGGDVYTTTNIEGRLTVSCMGQPQTGPTYGSAYCRSNILNPGEYAYFIGSKVDADSISLQATWENGKQSKIKIENYDGINGKSKKSFNLWINTLLQRPLLDYGMNVIKYSLSKNGSVVESGSFNVEVKAGEERICQRIGYYTSSSNQDCANAYLMCDRYFLEQNYCN